MSNPRSPLQEQAAMADSAEAWRRLSESEARLRATLDSALDGVISIDASGCLIDFNPAAEAIFGWKKAEILGRSMADLLVPAQHRDAHRQGLARFLQTRQSRILNQRIEITALRRDGTEFPVELAITSIRQNDSDLFTAYIRDITQRRLAEDRLRLAANVFTHAREGILITDAAGSIMDVNDAFTRITGYTRGEALGVQSGYARIPASFDDSARMLGTGDIGLLRRVHWPLLKRSTAAAALLVFVDVMKELPATPLRSPVHLLLYELKARRTSAICSAKSPPPSPICRST